MTTDVLSGLLNNNEGVTSLSSIKYDSGNFSVTETSLGKAMSYIADLEIFNNLFKDLVSDYVETRIGSHESAAS